LGNKRHGCLEDLEIDESILLKLTAAVEGDGVHWIQMVEDGRVVVAAEEEVYRDVIFS
jgi:hypothetical protein